MNRFIGALGFPLGGTFLAPTSSSSSSSSKISYMEPKPLPKDDMSSEIRMQSAAEHGRRDRSRIPLDVKLDNLLALLDSVDASATIASVRSHESSD